MFGFTLAMQCSIDMGIIIVHVSTRFPDLLGTFHVCDSRMMRCRRNVEFVASSGSCSRGVTPMCADAAYKCDIAGFCDSAARTLDLHQQASAAFPETTEARSTMPTGPTESPIPIVPRAERMFRSV